MKTIFKHGDVPDSKFDKRQLVMGIKAEMKEHTNDRSIAKQIAKSHLTENPRYYTYLKDMEMKMDKITQTHANVVNGVTKKEKRIMRGAFRL